MNTADNAYEVDEPLPSERNLSLNSVNGSGETQMGRGLSVASLKANLHFYATKKELAFHAHKLAIMQYEESLTALNNALTQKYLGKK